MCRHVAKRHTYSAANIISQFRMMHICEIHRQKAPAEIIALFWFWLDTFWRGMFFSCGLATEARNETRSREICTRYREGAKIMYSLPRRSRKTCTRYREGAERHVLVTEKEQKDMYLLPRRSRKSCTIAEKEQKDMHSLPRRSRKTCTHYREGAERHALITEEEQKVMHSFTPVQVD